MLVQKCLFIYLITCRPQGPDYRLYKSEPELTTVAEVDESNGEEKTEQISESESTAKGLSPGLVFTTFQPFSQGIQTFNCVIEAISSFAFL